MTEPRHEFLGMTRHAVLHDTSTGTRLVPSGVTFVTPDGVSARSRSTVVPATAFLAFVRERDPAMTLPKLIKRMEAVGWTWERQTATHPDTGDSITVDFFRVPLSWEPS